MQYSEISGGSDVPNIVNVVIEISVGGEPVKYELDKTSGALMVDRFLSTSMRYPGNYGFVPQTLGDDGDPLDVLIVCDIPLVPGSVISCRPIGVLRMTDEAGCDEKIIAVPAPKVSRMFEAIQSIDNISEYRLKQIAHFFEHYKGLESGKWVKLAGWGDRQEALAVIRSGFAAALKEAADGKFADAASEATVIELQAMLNKTFEHVAASASGSIGPIAKKEGEDWYFQEADRGHRQAG